MRIVLTYGTFDTFHYGHLSMLKRASELGDYLIVGVSTDEFNLGKGKISKFNFDQRFEWVSSIKYVDKAIPEKTWEQKFTDIKEFNVDVFTIGDDWTGKFDDLPCKVIYLKRTDGISSTQIKNID